MSNVRSPAVIIIGVAGVALAGTILYKNMPAIRQTLAAVGHGLLVKCGLRAPRIVVLPAAHDHGHIKINVGAGAQTFTISNAGDATLTIGAVALAGTNGASFVIANDHASAAAVEPGNQVTVDVSVLSAVTGVLAATLDVPSNDPNQPLVHVPLAARVSAPVVVVVSVDWEGLSLLPQNIDAMQNFRGVFPAVPLTHFMSEAYFDRSEAGDWPVIRAEMRRAMLPIDEHALHVHCWTTLLTNAGVVPTGNDDWGPGPSQYFNIWGDGGHANPLTDYAAADVETILRHSRLGLESAGGFVLSTSYRSGGWVMNGNIRTALWAAGFRIDSSAVPPGMVANMGLADVVLNAAWAGVNGTTQPYLLPAAGGGRLKEVPDNCALADYVTVLNMNAAMNNALAVPGTVPQLVQIGFHQETAAQLDLYDLTGRYMPLGPQGYLHRVANVIGGWLNNLAVSPNIEFLTVSDAAARFLG